MSTKEVTSIYDSLFSFERKQKGEDSYPIHKKLSFDDGTKDITEWINRNIDISADAHILDAGCGTGFTLLELCKDNQRTGIGISLSEKEVESARLSSQKNKVSEKCQFKVHDYGKSLDEKFDAIIAIESLKHAPDLKSTLSNLAGLLKEKGKIIIVEDNYIEGKVKAHLGKTFMKKWSVQELYTLSFYEHQMNSLGLKKSFIQDFSSLLPKRNNMRNKVMISIIGFVSKILPQGEKKELMNILHGGLIMDHFYETGAFEYQLMVFEK